MVLAQGDEEIVEQLSRLTWVDWVTAAAILVVGIILAGMVGRIIRRALSRTGVSDFIALILGRITTVVLGILAVSFSLSAVGVSFGPLIGALGLAGLALALAFQDILENVIAGLLMMMRRPIVIDDEITTNDYTGVVVDITLRAVVLVTLDGETVFIPNAMVWKNPVVNYSTKTERRSALVVGVAYATDLDRAKTVLEDAIARVDGVLEDQPVSAQVFEFGESSINFMLRYWHTPQTAEQWRLFDEVSRSVKRSLDDAGIHIPFPQRVVHMDASDHAAGQ